ncbi:hypothetical protein GFS60_06324 (plasmid) [Rhodococcus sp. WAY2]|nr:CopG family transcriptional regulator [Rhodococcus sp. WAY2]QHE72679.1 hypothetical protein GFS60_06324 [Rhodococcus sp. WAY2]
MTETAVSMGRVPVGDPIPLRFDPQTKQRLGEVAGGIGPCRFGALIRVAAHRLLSDPDRVPAALDEYRRASAAARSLPRVEIVFDLDPATDRRLEELARAHHTKRSAIVRVAAHRFLTAAGRFRPHLLREDARGDLTCRTRLHINRSTLVRLDRLTGRNGDVLTAAGRGALTAMHRRPVASTNRTFPRYPLRLRGIGDDITVRAPIADHDVGATLRKCDCVGAPNPCCGAGDQCELSFEVTFEAIHAVS